MSETEDESLASGQLARLIITLVVILSMALIIYISFKGKGFW